jgi:hypothetical protein
MQNFWDVVHKLSGYSLYVEFKSLSKTVFNLNNFTVARNKYHTQQLVFYLSTQTVKFVAQKLLLGPTYLPQTGIPTWKQGSKADRFITMLQCEDECQFMASISWVTFQIFLEFNQIIQFLLKNYTVVPQLMIIIGSTETIVNWNYR